MGGIELKVHSVTCGLGCVHPFVCLFVVFFNEFLRDIF